MRRSAGTTAAPTTRGPAQAPRPTSSTPTTTSSPAAHSSRSIASDGDFDRSAERSGFTTVVTGPTVAPSLPWSDEVAGILAVAPLPPVTVQHRVGVLVRVG